ncbi:EAL domain-containing protein [Dongshaea marina]|uniref:EAL domain-containing protein n=1 Tax=Dongshaea marina TaxID=2047966 RepID=UPI00131F1636|nr:EAL domain-containing protein [Dongshaea marina]
MELDSLSVAITLMLQALIIWLVLDTAITQKLSKEPSRWLVPLGIITFLVVGVLIYETELSVGGFSGMAPDYLAQSIFAGGLLLALYYAFRRWQCYQHAIQGAQLLERRRELANNHQLYRLNHNPDDEWPQSKRQELDLFIQNEEEKQERRLQMDRSYRNNLFKYPEMKIATRDIFERSLKAELNNPEVGIGSIFLIEFGELQDEDTLKLLSLSIHHLLREQPKHLVARYDHKTVAILLPETTELQAQNLTSMFSSTLYNYFSQAEDHSPFHMGTVSFTHLERMQEILNQAEYALHLSRRLIDRCWYQQEKGLIYKQSHGWSNWRKHLQLCINQNRLEFSLERYQDILGQTLFSNFMAKIEGISGNTLEDEQLSLMAEKSGLSLGLLDLKLKAACSVLFTSKENLCLNTHAGVLSNKSSLSQLLIELYGYPMEIRQRLIFEIRESEVAEQLSALKMASFALHALGCKLCISRVGRQVEAMEYVRELSVDYLKLDEHLLSNLTPDSRQSKALQSIRLMIEGTQTMLLAHQADDEAHWAKLQLEGIEGTHLAQG